MQKAYKIFEVHPSGLPRALFYGMEGTKLFEFGKTYAAEIKTVSENKRFPYTSGIHCVLHEELMPKYLKRFSAKRLPLLVVIEIHVWNVKQKPTKNSLAFLAEKMRIPLDARVKSALEYLS